MPVLAESTPMSDEDGVELGADELRAAPRARPSRRPCSARSARRSRSFRGSRRRRTPSGRPGFPRPRPSRSRRRSGSGTRSRGERYAGARVERGIAGAPQVTELSSSSRRAGRIHDHRLSALHRRGRCVRGHALVQRRLRENVMRNLTATARERPVVPATAICSSRTRRARSEVSRPGIGLADSQRTYRAWGTSSCCAGDSVSQAAA